MQALNPSLDFFIQLVKAESLITRRFDSGLVGISFTEFVILYHIASAKEERIRRIDLAEKIGFTASGITRILLPMEKVGLVSRQSDPRDARISYVSITEGGKEKLTDALENAGYLAEELLPVTVTHDIESFTALLKRLSGTGF